jgi:hypothetical protein
MSITALDTLRYPIGSFKYDESLLESYITDIATLPQQLEHAVEALTEEQLDTPYREGGWTIRQVVHHLADSHMNSYVRFRLALTEDKPTVKPYEEQLWAELPDARTAPVEISLDLLAALHTRWVLLVKSMTPEQFAREFVHPQMGAVPLKRATGMYAWHCRHHLAHITGLKERMGW